MKIRDEVLGATTVRDLPVVGIVIPTLGTRPGWLRDCLRSICSQTGIHLRVLLVGPDVPLLRQVAVEFNVDHLTAAPNGLSAAINEGWAAIWTGCDFVTWLGDDDLLAPESLEHTAAALLANLNAAFVYGRTRYIDGESNSIYLSSPTSWAPWYLKYGQDYVPQPGSLIRRSAITWDPPVDPALKNSMDLELFLRLALPGRPSWIYLRREVSAYRLHPEAITSNKGVADEGEMVRARYRGTGVQPNKKRRLLFIRKFIEKVFVWTQWHTPSPSVPLVDGVPYLKAASTSEEKVV